MTNRVCVITLCALLGACWLTGCGRDVSTEPPSERSPKESLSTIKPKQEFLGIPFGCTPAEFREQFNGQNYRLKLISVGEVKDQGIYYMVYEENHLLKDATNTEFTFRYDKLAEIEVSFYGDDTLVNFKALKKLVSEKYGSLTQDSSTWFVDYGDLHISLENKDGPLIKSTTLTATHKKISTAADYRWIKEEAEKRAREIEDKVNEIGEL